MGDRVSSTIVLCEDEAQERLVREYLNACRLPSRPPLVTWLVASKLVHGGNDVWVLNELPRQLQACRQRSKKAATLLVVVIDADDKSTEQRRNRLLDRLKQAGLDEFGPTEPAVFLIPKRHVETWISATLGELVTEDEDCKDWEPPSRDDFREAAKVLYQWSRPQAVPGPTCVPSLQAALPSWRTIG